MDSGDINILQTGVKSQQDFQKKRKDKELNRRKIKEERKNRVRASRA